MRHLTVCHCTCCISVLRLIKGLTKSTYCEFKHMHPGIHTKVQVLADPPHSIPKGVLFAKDDECIQCIYKRNGYATL